MKLLMQTLITLGLFAILAFCGFGFLASYEISEMSRRLPWQIGYGLTGVFCLLAAIRVWRPRRRAQTKRERPRL